MKHKPNRILVSDPVDKSLIEGLEEKGFEVDYKPDIEPGQLKEILHDYHAIVVRSRTKLTSELLNSGQGLKLIARAGIGTDNIDMNAAGDLGIKVVTAAGSSTDSVAELNLALLISIARNIMPLNSQLRKGTFRKAVGSEISGKTAGMIGFGRIGFQTASHLKALGLNIVAYDLYPSAELIGKVSGEYIDLDTLLERSDAVFISVTLLDGSKRILGKEQFGKMKKGAILINTSRAEVVDPDSLLEALKDGRLKGYGADVLWNEPPDSPVEKELISMDNVLITPHIGAQTVEGQARVARMTLENLLEEMEWTAQ